jgi:hypothetical protein
MNNHRFKMSFNESGYVKPTNNDIHSLINNLNIIKPQQGTKNVPINNIQIPVVNSPKNIQSSASTLGMPMINRVHNAKPGCSACGKKVA